MDPAADDRAALRTAASAAGTSAPTGAKMIAASSALGRRLVRAPAHAAPSERANACASTSPGRVNAKTSRPWRGDLRDDVRRRAEAVEAEPLRVARHARATR